MYIYGWNKKIINWKEFYFSNLSIGRIVQKKNIFFRMHDFQ